MNKTKIIFVIGGLFSGIGKGVLASSLSAVLKTGKLKVAIQKIDPYLNIDSGMMNPYEHGEVFVTKDGLETDLDLGHYERFLREKLTNYSSLTSGQIYWEILENERKGKYQGKTVNIYHVSEMIKKKIFAFLKKVQVDILVVELGGTIGDNDLYPYLIAAAQIQRILNRQEEKNVAFIFLSYVSYLANIQMFKTKPTQNSIFALRNNGIEPNFLVLRSNKPFDEDVRKKITQKCYLDFHHIYELPNVKSVYQIPEIIYKSKLIKNILNFFNLKQKVNILFWKKFTQKADLLLKTERKIKIAIIGKYRNFEQSYISLWHAFYTIAVDQTILFEYEEIPPKSLNQKNIAEILSKFNGILVPGGFGVRGTEGKILAINYARVNNIPFLGICLGFQLALIEIARNVLDWKKAISEEFITNAQTKGDWKFVIKNYDPIKKKMLIGEKKTNLLANTKVAKLYQEKFILERYRNRFIFNDYYQKDFTQAGVIFSGFVEQQKKDWTIFELTNHSFFIAVQYHCEWNSYPGKPHPIIKGFFQKMWENKKQF